MKELQGEDRREEVEVDEQQTVSAITDNTQSWFPLVLKGRKKQHLQPS